MTISPTAANARTPIEAWAPLGSVLFDTNVWLDYYLGREGVAAEVSRLIEHIRVAGHTIATTVSIKKDVFYILPRELRRLAKTDGDGSPRSDEAFTQIAWAILESMDDFATLVPLGMREDFFARHFRTEHADYEDDTLLATAQSLGSCLIVTSDRRLLERFSSQCKTPAQALELYGG